MGYGYKWRPSQTAKREFAEKMQMIEDFCIKNNIIQSRSGDSYYFSINGKKYRVSNHSIDASNRAAYDWAGNKIRELYHTSETEENTIYIHASKTRIIEIYNLLIQGYQLDGRGNIKQ